MRSFVDGQPGTTPENVKLLLPPRQSRGNSHGIRMGRCLGASLPKRMTASWFCSRMGPTEYKVAARSSHAMAGSPRIVGRPPRPRAPSRGVQCTPLRDGNTIPLRKGEQSMPTGRQPDGEHALNNAERQARYRARREAEQPLPKIRYRRPADRRASAQRWHDTVAGLVALQAENIGWHDALPDGLRARKCHRRSPSGHCRSRPRGAHRNRATARPWARLSPPGNQGRER
jgi:hypothetical protein